MYGKVLKQQVSLLFEINTVETRGKDPYTLRDEIVLSSGNYNVTEKAKSIKVQRAGTVKWMFILTNCNRVYIYSFDRATVTTMI